MRNLFYNCSLNDFCVFLNTYLLTAFCEDHDQHVIIIGGVWGCFLEENLMEFVTADFEKYRNLDLSFCQTKFCIIKKIIVKPQDMTKVCPHIKFNQNLSICLICRSQQNRYLLENSDFDFFKSSCN